MAMPPRETNVNRLTACPRSALGAAVCSAVFVAVFVTLIARPARTRRTGSVQNRGLSAVATIASAEAIAKHELSQRPSRRALTPSRPPTPNAPAVRLKSAALP